MSKINPNTRTMRNLIAGGLLAGVLLVPSVASAAGGGHYGHHGGHYSGGHRSGYGYGGHHGGYGYRSHYGGYGYRGHIGGLHLGLSFGHGGAYGGGYRGYGLHSRYGRYGFGYRSPYYGSYGTSGSYAAASAPRYRQRDTTPYVAEKTYSGQSVAAPWDLLAAGRYTDALRTFGHQASGDPGNSLPKVGYALASAMSGDLNTGAWAMRRALQANPDALEYVTVSHELRPRIEHLVHDYAQHTDAKFMVSTLRQLLGDGVPVAGPPVNSPVTHVTHGRGQDY